MAEVDSAPGAFSADVGLGHQPLTPVMAARLGAFFQVPARWWLMMQAEYDAAAVEADPALREGVTPMEPDPDVLITPKGILRLAPASPSEDRPLTISQTDLDTLPAMASNPAPRVVREVRYESGSVALVGDTP